MPLNRRVGAAVVIVLIGLAVNRWLPPAIGGPAGDAAYAAMVVAVIVLVAPRTPARVSVPVAIALCWAVELLQLTSYPATLSERWPPLRYLLGSTFVASDLAWYVVGALIAGVGLARARRPAA